jgi:flagellar FliL protein
MAKKEKDAAEGEDGAKPAKKGLFANKLVLAGIGVVALAALGGGGWFFFLRKPADPEAAAAAAEAAKPKPKAGFVEMRDMTINIAGGGGDRQNFIKLKVALEVADDKITADITPMLPRVEDLFQVYLRELRMSDLEGSAGTYRLKDELLRRVNMAVHPARVEAVLFKEFLVQ